MSKPTEKQIKYRRDLIKRKIKNGTSGRKLIEILIAVNLPEPQTKQEASEQIDGLIGSLKPYCKNHRDWFTELSAKIESLGEPHFRAILQSNGYINTLYPTDFLIAAFQV